MLCLQALHLVLLKVGHLISTMISSVYVGEQRLY